MTPDSLSSPNPTHPSVSVIILNYNGKQFLQSCLQSVLNDPYQPKEILLVDNASTDGSLEEAEPFRDRILLIRNPQNYGFPRGCNEGIKRSQGEIIVLLNIDTEVRPGWLTELIEPFLLDSTIGITGSKLLFPEGNRIQFAGGGMRPNGLTFHEGYGQVDEGQYDEAREVEYITGASMAIRRNVLERLGGLDEGFPLYFEDLDLCFRAHQQGWRVWYQPRSVVYHFETYGTPKHSFTYYYKYHRGRIRFLLKNFGARYFLSVFLPAEFRWYRQCNLRDQWLPLLKAYISQLPKTPYFWVRGFIHRRQ